MRASRIQSRDQQKRASGIRKAELRSRATFHLRKCIQAAAWMFARSRTGQASRGPFVLESRGCRKTGAGKTFCWQRFEAVEQLDQLLRDAVRTRMIADVPLGVFLSGGIDSSAITALMQAQSANPIRSFSIGFREAAFDESADARAVAAHLGTEHIELIATPAEAREVIPLLPEMYDEPFGDSSQIPTHLVSRMTRQHVTVALSGDGGDEIFGGYNRHVWVSEIWKQFGGLPASARRALGRSLLCSHLAPGTRYFAPSV